MKLANFTHHLRKILSFFTITKVINVNNEIRRVNCFFQIEDCSSEASHRSAYDKQILRGGKNVIETNDLDPEPEGQNRKFKIMKTNNEAGPQISENSPALWTVIYEFHYHGLRSIK